MTHAKAKSKLDELNTRLDTMANDVAGTEINLDDDKEGHFEDVCNHLDAANEAAAKIVEKAHPKEKTPKKKSKE